MSLVFFENNVNSRLNMQKIILFLMHYAVCTTVLYTYMISRDNDVHSTIRMCEVETNYIGNSTITLIM
jgi:hypothetical protein